MHVARQAPKTTDKGEIKLSKLQQTVLKELFHFVCKHRAWHLPSNPEHYAFWKKPPASLEHLPRTAFNELAEKQLIISVTATSLPESLLIQCGNDSRFFHESPKHANRGHLFPSTKGLRLITPGNNEERANLRWAAREAKRLEELLQSGRYQAYMRYTNIADPYRESATLIARERTRRDAEPSPTRNLVHFIEARHELLKQSPRLPEAKLVMPKATIAL